jgi:hypothetical protein
MIAIVAALLIAAALGAWMYLRLRDTGFRIGLSALLVGLALLQMSTALTAQLLPAIFLTVALILIALNAIEFAQRENVRNVIGLGGSLALVQALNPLGSVIAASLVPLLLGTRTGRPTRSHNGALLVLLLFIPISCGVALAYLTRVGDVSVAGMSISEFDYLLKIHSFFAPHDVRVLGFLHLFCLSLSALPIWAAAIYSPERTSRLIAAVAGAELAAIAFAALLGRAFPLALSLPALAALSVLSIGAWPWLAAKPAVAVSLLGGAAVLSWLCMVLVA